MKLNNNHIMRNFTLENSSLQKLNTRSQEKNLLQLKCIKLTNISKIIYIYKTNHYFTKITNNKIYIKHYTKILIKEA